ncbi:MAG: DUF4366 domain-containing protein [Deltaproteobacteria bacterium]|jgi:hypothetical protein|nr:DUF4366 domain-containing protein [Deltaproteobacteria bacterium]
MIIAELENDTTYGHGYVQMTLPLKDEVSSIPLSQDTTYLISIKSMSGNFLQPPDAIAHWDMREYFFQIHYISSDATQIYFLLNPQITQFMEENLFEFTLKVGEQLIRDIKVQANNITRGTDLPASGNEGYDSDGIIYFPRPGTTPPPPSPPDPIMFDPIDPLPQPDPPPDPNPEATEGSEQPLPAGNGTELTPPTLPGTIDRPYSYTPQGEGTWGQSGDSPYPYTQQGEGPWNPAGNPPYPYTQPGGGTWDSVEPQGGSYSPPYTPETPYAPETPKKSSLGLILGIVIPLVILLLAGGGAYWYFKIYKGEDSEQTASNETGDETESGAETGPAPDTSTTTPPFTSVPSEGGPKTPAELAEEILRTQSPSRDVMVPALQALEGLSDPRSVSASFGLVMELAKIDPRYRVTLGDYYSPASDLPLPEGVNKDPVAAREEYQEASSYGIQVANERLEDLRDWAMSSESNGFPGIEQFRKSMT